MSASREKKKRTEARERGELPNRKEEQSLNPAIFRNMITVLCVIAVIAVMGIALVGSGIPQQFMTAAVVDGRPVSVAEFNYHYYNTLNGWAPYLSYYGVDTSRPLYRQMINDNETWHDYMASQAMVTLSDTMYFSGLAESKGVTLAQEDTDMIDMTMEAFGNSASKAGVSEARYLRNLFGRGTTAANLRAAMERELLAMRYEKIEYEGIAITGDEVLAHYEENRNNYDKVTYRSFSVSKYLTDEEYDELEEQGFELWEEVETDIGTMTAEEKIAYDRALSLSEAEGLTEDTFNELARGLVSEEEFELYDEDPDYTLVTESVYYEGEMYDWLFDTARERGEITVADDGSNFVVLLFIERVVSGDSTVTIRQAFIAPPSSSSNEAEWEQVRAKGQDALDAWESAGKGEDGFIELVKDVSMDTNTKFGGGLFKEMSAGYMGIDEIDEWAFDESRSPGDYVMVRSDLGYHIMYFVEWGRAENIVQTELDMRNDKYNELREVMLSSTTEPTRDWLGFRFIIRV